MALYGLIALLLIAWLALFMLKVAGAAIHLILVVAVVLFVVNLLSGRRTAV